MASSKQSRLRALVAIIDAQIVLALAWVETLLQLRELQAQLQTHFLDLMKVDLLHLQERWSAIYWTAEMKEQIPQPDPRLMMVVTAHLSSVGEHGNDEQHHGVSTSCDLSSSRLRTIPFCHSHLPNSNGFILTVSPLFKGSRSTVPLLQYWACRYLRHSRLPRHSSSSVTGCGARKLAVTGRRLLVLLLKRRCAALTWILASRMLRWSSKAKSIQSTRSALSENLPSFLHCAFCFTITLIMLWAAREMFKVPFSRCEPL